MRLKSTKRKMGKRAAVAAIILIVLVWGGYHFARWQHAQDIEARINLYWPIIQKEAQANRLSPQLVRSVIRHESGGRADALSSRQARGLMQITPLTLQEVQRRDRSIQAGDLGDPAYNIHIGTRYLRQLLDRFDNDVPLALAAYNMGPTRLAEIRANHPELSSEQLVDQYAPPETQAYCRQILADQPLRPATGDSVNP